VHSEQKALRLGASPVISTDALSRKAHPGQQPTNKERGAVSELTIFRWERGNATGVPEHTRLFAFSR
jgi:hypothetical protein